jgi:hypothetical protein
MANLPRSGSTRRSEVKRRHRRRRVSQKSAAKNRRKKNSAAFQGRTVKPKTKFMKIDFLHSV